MQALHIFAPSWSASSAAGNSLPQPAHFAMEAVVVDPVAPAELSALAAQPDMRATDRAAIKTRRAFIPLYESTSRGKGFQKVWVQVPDPVLATPPRVAKPTSLHLGQLGVRTRSRACRHRHPRAGWREQVCLPRVAKAMSLHLGQPGVRTRSDARRHTTRGRVV